MCQIMVSWIAKKSLKYNKVSQCPLDYLVFLTKTLLERDKHNYNNSLLTLVADPVFLLVFFKKEKTYIHKQHLHTQVSDMAFFITVYLQLQ